jgi:hypothetical protein
MATHAALMLLLSVALAGGCTAALMMVLISTNNNPAAGAWRHLSLVGVLLSIPLFFVLLRATSGWFARHVPARCPSCGGPAYSNGIPRTRRLDDLTYACRNCGSATGANGSLAPR